MRGQGETSGGALELLGFQSRKLTSEIVTAVRQLLCLIKVWFCGQLSNPFCLNIFQNREAFFKFLNYFFSKNILLVIINRTINSNYFPYYLYTAMRNAITILGPCAMLSTASCAFGSPDIMRVIGCPSVMYVQGTHRRRQKETSL